MTGGRSVPAGYCENVFINCPFDDVFKPLFHAIVFTTQACGFNSRCALEFDGDANRLNKIMDVIHGCQFGIHDVSVRDGRLNMPLELGLFMGCQRYGSSIQRMKSHLILEGNPFSSKSYLSDLAGQDPMAHKNDVAELINCLRNWLASRSKWPARIPHAPYIMESYRKFQTALPIICSSQRWEPDRLLYPEFLDLAKPWISTQF